MGQALWALGLMSGTSLDGVDAALLKTDGESILEFGPSAEMPYHEGAANWAMEVTRNWSLYRQRVRGDDMAVELLNAENEVIRNHAAAVAGVLTRPKYLVQPPLPDVIGFHGQTVAHSPANGWTWQIGDGGALARALIALSSGISGLPMSWRAGKGRRWLLSFISHWQDISARRSLLCS